MAGLMCALNTQPGQGEASAWDPQAYGSLCSSGAEALGSGSLKEGHLSLTEAGTGCTR